MRFIVGVGILAAILSVASCSRSAPPLTLQDVQQRYGITDAYAGQVDTASGSLHGTLVPVTLPGGRRAELIIPDQRSEPHAAYLRDADGLHPIQVADQVSRDQIVSSPAVVGRRAEAPHTRHRSWEKEALIIGGSAGAGTAVGALTGGKKGAGIGAAAGGLGGLIYDLATRKNP
jgi:hypothetical protein